VASERAFSSAGITISKHCSRLDADIVKALQCLKSLISCEDLVLRSYPSLADEEITMDNADQQRANQDGTSHDVVDEEAVWDFEAITEDVNIDDDDNNDNDNDIEEL
jgi:hypothetical protein